MLNGILSVFLLAFFAPLIIKIFGRKGGWLLALLPFALCIYFLTFIPLVQTGKSIYLNYSWFPNLNINLSIYLDGLSLLFALLITGIGAVIIIYAEGYLGNHPQLGRFYSFLLVFMASMLGTVLCNNLITIFIFWELTSISSFLLIGFHHQREQARNAAVKALIITGAGGLALLLGFLLLGELSGNYELHHIMQRVNEILVSSWYTPILILILLGAFTKSAQFPFHFWLPTAMEAPTPVSAYLHSATMVNLGVYLLGRLHPILASNPLWFQLVTSTGILTMLTGAILALRQTDIKLMLAYTTITALGALVFLLGTNNELTMQAVVAFLFAHALYKGALFMAVGNIDHEMGTRDINALSGLIKKMPITFLVTAIAAASMAGLPPFLGFFGKELIYEAKLASRFISPLLIAIVVSAMMVTAMISIKLVIKPFFGKPMQKEHMHEASVSLWLSPLILASLTVLFGLMPYLIDNELIGSAAHAIFNSPVTVNLSYWHGFSQASLLSLITIFGAAVLFKLDKKIYILNEKYSFLFNFGPANLYKLISKVIMFIARLTTNTLQNGYLRIYSAFIFLAFITVISSHFIYSSHLKTIPVLFNVDTWLDGLLVAFIICCAIGIVFFRAYLTSIILLGLLGIGNTLIFLTHGAPDVAMTQILVETLIVIIVVLSLYRQPMLPKPHQSSVKWRILKFIIAIITGITITLLLLEVCSQPLNQSIDEFYWANGELLAHGYNIVNLIIVDFRALDTLGEIIVLAAAAIGVYSLIKLKK